MNLRIILAASTPSELVNRFFGKEFRKRILDEVLGDVLGARDFGPAEFVVEPCILVPGAEPLCQVCMDFVTVTGELAPELGRALITLETIIAEMIQPYYTSKNPIQLFVFFVLDRTGLGTGSLLERKALYLPPKEE